MFQQSTLPIVCLRSLIAAWIFAVIGSAVQAQPRGSSADSIECTIANADLVFVAKLVELGHEQRFQDIRYHRGAIEIEETLKDDIFHDEPYRKLSVRLPYYSASDLADWKDQSLRLLVTFNEAIQTAEIKAEAEMRKQINDMLPGGLGQLFGQ